jgi:hypothetical protein
MPDPYTENELTEIPTRTTAADDLIDGLSLTEIMDMVGQTTVAPADREAFAYAVSKLDFDLIERTALELRERPVDFLRSAAAYNAEREPVQDLSATENTHLFIGAYLSGRLRTN